MKREGSSRGPSRGPRRGGDLFFGKRQKACPFKSAGIKHIDYKDVDTLFKFVTERGKLIPRRITGVSLHNQKKLAKAVKRARYMALLPFVANQ